MGLFFSCRPTFRFECALIRKSDLLLAVIGTGELAKTKFPCKNVTCEWVPEMNIWYPSDPGCSNSYVLTCVQEPCQHQAEAAQLYGCNIHPQTQTLIKSKVLWDWKTAAFLLKSKVNSNSCIFSCHCFPSVYHCVSRLPVIFICWASESNCQSSWADEQQSG